MSILDALRPGALQEVPLVYSKEAVVFPKSLTPLLAATKFPVAAVDEALRGDKRIVAALLKGVGDDKSAEIEVHPVGTLARIVQQVRLPDGSIRLLVEGESRVRIRRTVFRKDHLTASVEALADEALPAGKGEEELGAAMRLVKRSFAQYAALAKKVPPEVLASVDRRRGFPAEPLARQGHLAAPLAETPSPGQS